MSYSSRLCLTFLALALGPESFAGTFIVNSTLDMTDATALGDGVVDADLGTPGDQITLRAAIQEANALAGIDTIELPAGVFDLTIGGASENQCATGDLDVLDDLSIFGLGASQTFIDANQITDRVFHVQGADCGLFAMTIRRGTTATASQDGGGIFATGGTLSVWESTITENHSKDTGGGIAIQGAPFFAYHTLFSENTAADDGGGLSFGGNLSSSTIQNCTFSKNITAGDGGAVMGSHANLVVINSTFSKNEAKRGGALAIAKLSQLVIYNTTVARNLAPKGSGIWENTSDGDNDTIALVSTIMANNQSTNYSGDALLSLGSNLDSGSTCNLTGAGDKQNKNPRLGLLKNNGGKTPTIGLKPASPAVDAGHDIYARQFDQRGMPRVNIPGKGPSTSDMGAFERQTP